MKTRIVFTKIWKDIYFCNLSQTEQLAFIFFITNETVGLTGIYELDDRSIASSLKITQQQLNKIKEKFMADRKIYFYNGWIKIVNHDKYNNFTGIKNEIAVKRELALISQEIIENLDRVSIGYPVLADTLNNHKSIINNHKSIINNHKPETINQKPEMLQEKKYTKREDITQTVIDALSEKYSCPPSFVLNCWDTAVNWLDAEGKTKKNYKAFLDNWVKRQIANDENLKSKQEPLNNFRRTGGNVILEERE